METRREIESMRVVELREFLKRHGHQPTVITRSDGTPGAPRKADLLRVALAIEHKHRARDQVDSQAGADIGMDGASDTPVRAHTLSSEGVQGAGNVFQSRIISPSRPTAQRGEDQNLESSDGRQRGSSARRNSVVGVQQVSIQAEEHAEGRRDSVRNSNVVDRAVTPGRPEARRRRSSAAWIDPLLLNAALSGKSEEEGDGRVLSREGQRERVERAKRSGRVVPVVDEPPPPAPPVRFIDAELPEDDEEGDADFGDDEAGLIDEGDWDENVMDEDLFDASVLEEDRVDVLVSSDFEHVSDRADESTVETDGEVEGKNTFEAWDVDALRRWLDGYAVPYGRRAAKSELVSLAKAYSLQLEMEAERLETIRQKDRKARRRRVISAPTPDDEDGDGDIVEIRAEERRKAGRARQARKQEKMRRRTARTSRWPRVRISWTHVVVMMTLVLGMMIVWSIINVYRSSTKPFCDTGKTTSSVESGYGCRKCPKFGQCENGLLHCEPGYVAMRKTCVEDKESSIMAEEIAREASALLAQQAGSAECRETESSHLSAGELRDALRILLLERQPAGFFEWSSRREFRADKFELAFEKALDRLGNEEDFPDISVSMLGKYSSTAPTYSFRCMAKLFLRRNWRSIAAFLAFIAFCIYVRVLLYLRRLDQEKLHGAYKNALEILRAQKADYVRQQEEFAFMSDVVLRQEVLGYPTEANIQFWKRVEVFLKNDNRLAYSANRVVKGVPSNTYEWRSRVSVGGGYSSGGSLMGDSPATSDIIDSVGTPTDSSIFGTVRRRLFSQRA